MHALTYPSSAAQQPDRVAVEDGDGSRGGQGGPGELVMEQFLAVRFESAHRNQSESQQYGGRPTDDVFSAPGTG
jgi:hypothetical protein